MPAPVASSGFLVTSISMSSAVQTNRSTDRTYFHWKFLMAINHIVMVLGEDFTYLAAVVC